MFYKEWKKKGINKAKSTFFGNNKKKSKLLAVFSDIATPDFKKNVFCFIIWEFQNIGFFSIISEILDFS